MARNRDDRPQQRRFSRSGHTSHTPGRLPGDTGPQAPPPGQYPPPNYPGPQHYGPHPQPYPPGPPPQPYPPGQYPPGPPPQQPYPAGPYPAGQYPPVDAYGNPTYHHVGPPRQPAHDKEPASPAVAMTKAAITGTNRAARVVTRKVIDASKADGAHESGLTALIWNQVLSYGTDAMITVALAGTVFFGASADAKRGNVLLYLLITMAPFALVAPVIGPFLDRFAHGRRWTMAGTAIGRAVLALIMASHPTELLVLYPCALGSLVLSKAYGVVRAAAAPRLVPPGLTLTEVNARLSIFGLGATMIAGGFIGVVIKTSGSYTLGLVITAAAFATCAFFAFRLPPQIDSAVDYSRVHPVETHAPPVDLRLPPVQRLKVWARRGFDDRLVLALQGESSLRFLSGLLTIFLAFYVESTAHGVDAALQLGAVVFAAGAGNVSGNAVGTRIKFHRPDLVIAAGLGTAAATCLVVALLFNITLAVVGMFVSSVCNALAKIALDALVQRDVDESLRSSAFARSETFLQLAWVLGAAIGVALPADTRASGALGFWVATVVLAGVTTVVVLRGRALDRAAAGGMRRATSARDPYPAPGSVAPRPPDAH